VEHLAKNQEYTVTVEGFSFDGGGVARIGGRAVFIPGALPGETWDIRIHKVTATAVYAGGVTLLSASPSRRESDCPHFGKCGGCQLRHMDYAAELDFKRSRVNEAIRRIGALDFQVAEILGCDRLEGYRNKGIYAVDSRDGVPVAGFYRPRSHDLIPITRCLIQRPEADRAVAAVLGWMKARHILPYDETSGQGSVRHIFLRSALRTGETMACVVSARGFGAHTAALTEALRAACPELSSIVLCINRNRLNTVLSGDFYTLWGSDAIREELCGLRFRLSPLSFFQINPPQAEKLYRRAVSYASPDGDATVLDLYCGTGTISLCLAQGSRRVIGAELVPEAVADAEKNAVENGISNVEFLCGDAGEAARTLAKRRLRPDAIVVDPPRKGLSPAVIDAAAEMSPRRLVYVSCDPGTLARDLRRFAEKGYLPVTGTAVDMFPRTCHVETVVLMSRVDR